MKTCFKCGSSKRLSDFYHHPRTRDGRLNKCIACAKLDSRLRYKKCVKDSEWVEKERLRIRLRPNRKRDYVRNRRNPLQIEAHRQVHRAILRGDLVRPAFCAECGKKPKRVLHGHHDDYTKPLVVIFICELCHGKKIRKL